MEHPSDWAMDRARCTWYWVRHAKTDVGKVGHIAFELDAAKQEGIAEGAEMTQEDWQKTFEYIKLAARRQGRVEAFKAIMESPERSILKVAEEIGVERTEILGTPNESWEEEK